MELALAGLPAVMVSGYVGWDWCNKYTAPHSQQHRWADWGLVVALGTESLLTPAQWEQVTEPQVVSGGLPHFIVFLGPFSFPFFECKMDPCSPQRGPDSATNSGGNLAICFQNRDDIFFVANFFLQTYYQFDHSVFCAFAL